MRGRFLWLALAVLLLGVTQGAAAETRGLTIQLKASEAKDAPVTEEVQLYGSSHALVIGIDKYTGGWPRLSKAVEDARAIAKELRRKGFSVTLKTNLKAEALRTTLREFFAIKGADPEARLLLWFAGHGHTINGEGFLVPADAPAATEPTFLVSALPMRDFGSLVRLARSKHVLSVFDSCFSGTIFEARAGIAPAAITKKTTKPVRQFITSGDAGQQVRDDGSFREYFLRALRGEEKADFNGDNYVTGEELGLFLNQRMAALTGAAQTPKAGKLHDVRYNQGDFVFALAAPPPRKSTPTLPRAPTGMTAEMMFWQSIKDSANAADFEDYLAQFPRGIFAGLAKRRMETLKGQQSATLRPVPKPQPAARTAQVLGMTLTAITPKLRHQYKIKDNTRGVVVTAVAKKSDGANKGLRPGDVIIEISQMEVRAMADVMASVEEARRKSRRSVLLLLEGQSGLRFVALRL